jgi:cytochrome c-type biogenesis protein CcmH
LAVSSFAVLQASDPQQPAQNFAPMDQGAYKPVKREAKPGATPQLTIDQRDALEHGIKCMCGCSLDVYTCRTTDFTCPLSPAMHRDVVGLIDGGYSANEILEAFTGVYGEQVLMAPKKTGFNWAGYITPFIALSIGAAGLTLLLRRWTERAAAVASIASVPVVSGATDDELSRLAAAVRDDSGDDE